MWFSAVQGGRSCCSVSLTFFSLCFNPNQEIQHFSSQPRHEREESKGALRVRCSVLSCFFPPFWLQPPFWLHLPASSLPRRSGPSGMSARSAAEQLAVTR